MIGHQGMPHEHRRRAVMPNFGIATPSARRVWQWDDWDALSRCGSYGGFIIFSQSFGFCKKNIGEVVYLSDFYLNDQLFCILHINHLTSCNHFFEQNQYLQNVLYVVDPLADDPQVKTLHRAKEAFGSASVLRTQWALHATWGSTKTRNQSFSLPKQQNLSRKWEDFHATLW